jgi:hypothetical protein
MKEDKLSVWIKKEDVKDWESFKQVVLQKHGKLHGVLGDEVMNAIKTYLALEDKKIDPQKHTRTDKKNRLKNIMERTIARGYTNEALKRDIEEFIKEEGIRDQRTVDDYFKALIDYGFITHDRFSIYKIYQEKMPRAIE